MKETGGVWRWQAKAVGTGVNSKGSRPVLRDEAASFPISERVHTVRWAADPMREEAGERSDAGRTRTERQQCSVEPNAAQLGLVLPATPAAGTPANQQDEVPDKSNEIAGLKMTNTGDQC